MAEPTKRVKVIRFYHVWYEAEVEIPLDENGEWSNDDVYNAADEALFTEIERSFEDSYITSV